MERDYQIMVGTLATVPFLMVLGNSMLIPEFPKIKAALDINQFQVGLMITLFSAAAGLSIPFLGYLSDKFGRKTVLLPSLITYGLGGVLAGIAAIFLAKKGYYIILLGRVIQGIGAAGTYPIVIALVGDLFQSDERSKALGIVESTNGLGKVVSPLLGAAVALIVWHALFFSYALLAIPIVIAVYLLVNEPEDNQQEETLADYLSQIKDIFNEKGSSFFFCLLAGVTVLFLLFGVLSYISDLFETKYQITGLKKGIIISLPILFMSTTAYLSGNYLSNKGEYYKQAIALGLIVAAISLISLPFLDGLYLYLTLIAVLGTGNGLVLTSLNTLVTSTASATHRGGVTSIYGSSRFLGVAAGPPTFSLLNRISSLVMFSTAAVIALVVSGLTFYFVEENVLLADNQS